ncbi:hypothetical protein BG006_010571 [Podila minutissima]|uniref:Uncharacterized protein n=1 Tax=Podila minutissima TaxID=64525 RepID=A0A9P5VIN6_9FUNG|nr:hypothetical protein BG006_010571 [Podila minutissima]
MAHYRSNGATSSNNPGLLALRGSSNPSILTMSNKHHLNEDDQHEFEAYAICPPPRTMRQAPKLLTLDDYNLISLGYKPVMSRSLPWISVAGIVTVAASVAFYFASVLGQLLVSVHRVTLTPAILVMFHLGAILFWQVINLFPIRGIGYISTVTGLFALGVTVALITVVLSLAGVDASMAHVSFTAFLNYSGSPSTIYAALSSTLMASFVFCPQDTVIRMSEESRRPERTMPWMMTGSTVLSLLAGLPLVLTLNFAVIKPIKGLLDESVPGVKVIVETLGDHAAVTYLSMVLVVISFAGFVRLVAATRVVYSFARDGGVPNSSYWNHLHPRRKTPQRISWLVTTVCMCCIFPFFWGNAEAFRWISSLACITANLCYVFPLWMRLTREGKLHFIPGTFSLGPFSKLLHVISIIWLLGLSLVLMLPSTFPLTKNNFNYAPVALVALMIMFAISWFKARTDFTGGAKDVSRASHRMPARPMTDLPPRKPQPAYRSNMAAIEPRTLNMPMVQQPPISRQLANQSVTRSLNLSSVMRANNNKRMPVPQRQPPTDTPKNTEGVRDQRHQASNATMNSQTSVQSHPSSILGIPFSDSPEMMHREINVKSPDPVPLSLPPQPVSSPSSSSKSGLLLTLPYVEPGTVIPEISIAPPTTISSTSQDSRSQAGSKRQKSLTKGKSKVGTTGKAESPPTISVIPVSTPTTSRPMNAIDSIFKMGVGLGNKISATVQSKYTSTNNYIYGVPLRSSKDRVPTPYPLTIESATDDVSSLEDIHPYPEPSTFTSGYYHGSSLSPPPRPLLKTTSRADIGPSSKSDYEYSSSLHENVDSASISQFTTLDGYPLTHAPSMIVTQSESLSAPSMLPLSRTPTIQQSNHDDDDYSPSIQMLGEEEDHDDLDGLDGLDDGDDNHRLERVLYEDEDAQIEVIATTNPSEEDHEHIEIGEEDASYKEEYNHQYPVISISPAYLKALIPSASSSVGLFQLPNRDISLKEHGAKVPLLHKDTKQKEEDDARDLDRHDPIERLTHQELDPEQHHLERTRSVASWAQEQAKIQQRRVKKRARAEALKALRKGSLDGLDGKTTRKKSVGEVSSTMTTGSSKFSDSLSSWTSSQSSRGRIKDEGRGKGKGGTRYQVQPMQQSRALGFVKEGVPMQFIDGEEDDDTDIEDVVYPEGEGQGVQSKGDMRRSVDIESVGAGVGRL